MQPDLTGIIRRRRNEAALRQGYVQLLVRVLLVLLCGLFVFGVCFSVSRMHGTDMFPAFKDGDLLIGYRLMRNYSKGDAVLFERDGEECVGRIAAFGGDIVEVNETGAVYVNGTAQSGEIIYSTYPVKGIEYPYKVPPDSVFILCDYRTNCTDSRVYGAVPLQNVQAKILTILRRRTI